METHQSENIDRLIACFLAQKASEEEIDQLEAWLKASDANRTYFAEIQNIWASSETEYHINDEQTASAYQKVDKRIGQPKGKMLFMQYFQRIAAAILIPLALGTYFLGSRFAVNDHPSGTIAYNEVFAANGTRSLLKLPDGSQVWLNSRSSLKYPVQFTEENRKVYLKGEAYFEVESDASKPFIVQTQSLSVRATGTKFNVSALGSSPRTEVSLLEGKVAVSRPSGGQSSALLKNLHPNEHLSFDSITGETKVDQEDVYRYIAWKDGKLIFRNERLADVVNKIGRLYNVDIEIEGKALQEFRYRATFQEETITDVMKLLKLSSPIDYKELSRKPDLDGTFPKKKFIISPAKR